MAKRRRRKSKKSKGDAVSRTDELMHRVEKCIIKHGPEGKKTEKCIEKAERDVLGDD
jgi:hypothetical protein